MTSILFVFVLLDPVRSAEPPIVFVNTLLIVSSTSCEDFLVAQLGFSSENVFLISLIALSSSSEISPLISFNNSVPLSLLSETLVSHSSLFEEFFNPISLQASFTSVGVSNSL